MIINEKYLSSGMSVQSIVKIVLIITFLSSSFWISAQQSQFVRVSSNGNTSIYTNLKNAFGKRRTMILYICPAEYSLMIH